MSRTFDPLFLDYLETRVLPEWRGSVWREVLGDTDPLRPNQRGARWNPPGIEALYCSVSYETAAAEIDHLISLQSIPVSKRRRVQLEVALTRVVDLRETSGLVEFGMDRPDRVGNALDAPQLVGRAVAWLGCAGLLVHSVRHTGENLVIYTNQMTANDMVEISQ